MKKLKLITLSIVTSCIFASASVGAIPTKLPPPIFAAIPTKLPPPSAQLTVIV